MIHIPNTRGENSRQAKLTDKLVAEIRKLSAGGMTNKAIGRKYGISPGHISNIVNRRVWGHV